MDCIAGRSVEENVFAVPVAETGRTRLGAVRLIGGRASRSRAHPSTNPTIEMTAAVREYARRARCHADGSGKFSRNHSWKTEGNLRRNQVSTPSACKVGECKSLLLQYLRLEAFGGQLRIIPDRVEDALQVRTLRVYTSSETARSESVADETYPSRDVHGCVALAEDAAQDDNVRHPFDQAALFVQRDDRIGADVCRFGSRSACERKGQA